MIDVHWKSCPPINAQVENEFIDGVVRRHHDMLGRDLVSLEIGSFQGLSAALLAQYGTVYAIDLWGDIHDCFAHPETIGQENFVPFIKNMLRLNLIDRVFPMVSSSAILDTLHPLKCDIIYVDASHYYPAVKLDIQRSQKHLRGDGLWIFHDYKREGDNPNLGVNIAVDELLATETVVIYEQFNGCIVLRWKPGLEDA